MAGVGEGVAGERRIMMRLYEVLREDWEAGGAKAWGDVFDPVAEAWEQRYLEAAQREFGVELGELSAAVRGGKGVIPDWTAVTRSIDAVLRAREGDWRAGFIPLFEAQMAEFGDEWAIALGVDFALVNPAVDAFVQEYGFKFVERHQGVTREAVAALVGQAQAEGWGILDLIGSQADGTGLRGLYAAWEFLRAEMIARTETIRVENAGALAAYLGAGVVETQWWTAEDERVCPFCGKLHGKIWTIGTPLFRVGDEFRVDGSVLRLNYEDVVYPPLHVFCRCVVLPVVG